MIQIHLATHSYQLLQLLVSFFFLELQVLLFHIILIFSDREYTSTYTL